MGNLPVPSTPLHRTVLIVAPVSFLHRVETMTFDDLVARTKQHLASLHGM
jgi:hypothetical protein